jgi:hypothetical protein
MTNSWRTGILAALLLGAILRWACLPAEFWLDEIWSYDLSRQAGSLLGVFTVRHDNNHHLNTLWLYLCPNGASWTLYRLPSFVAGLAGIVLAAVFAKRWGSADAVFAAFLTAGCYWLVLSSAEARGYAPAVCFALLALLALTHYFDRGSRRSLVLFWLSSIAGFLSHLTFVHAYLGFVAWTLRRRGKEHRSAIDEIRSMLVFHGVPGVFFVAFYLVSLRGMDVGGGPPDAVTNVLARLVSMGLGGPALGLAMLPWLIGAALLFGAGSWLLAKEPGEMWVFFTVAVVGSPALFLLGLALRPGDRFLFERYFLIPFAFFLVLSAYVLGTLWRTALERRYAMVRRIAALLVLIALLAGNLWHVRAFVRAGRGEFHEALPWLVAHDQNAVVTVTGDHDFRVRKYFEFYVRYLNDRREMRYLGKDELPADGADWLLIHRENERDPPGPIERDAKGNTYRLAQAYPSRGRGCWGWFVYRRAVVQGSSCIFPSRSRNSPGSPMRLPGSLSRQRCTSQASSSGTEGVSVRSGRTARLQMAFSVSGRLSPLGTTGRPHNASYIVAARLYTSQATVISLSPRTTSGAW